MPKITFIGAGSLVFTRNLTSDILLAPALQDSTITLMDIDAQTPGAGARHRAGHDRAPRPQGARRSHHLTAAWPWRRRLCDHDLPAGRAGRLQARHRNPAEVWRGAVRGRHAGAGRRLPRLRTIPVLLDLCDEMDELAPDALLLNYVNPMAANCWAVADGSGRPHIGLCHSVQGTSEMLAKWIGVPYDRSTSSAPASTTRPSSWNSVRGKEDLYPLLWEAIERPEVIAEEPVRTDMMKYFGYFVTESSGHASEYMPYFRKTRQDGQRGTGAALHRPVNHWFDYGAPAAICATVCTGWSSSRATTTRSWAASSPPARSHEYGSQIIEAMETNKPVKVAGNVPNSGLITNLPAGCCVEVPCLVDGSGVQPTFIGNLPPQLAALNRTNINVQSLIVEAALTGTPTPSTMPSCSTRSPPRSAPCRRYTSMVTRCWTRRSSGCHSSRDWRLEIRDWLRSQSLISNLL
jgi:alpha-galactosidase